MPMAGKQRILIIEDDLFLRTLIGKKLETDGFAIDMAVDGEEGLEKVDGQKKPDLVLLDIVLPKMRGFEVLERMKKDPKTKTIPVILLTNLGDKEDAEKGVKLGAADYLVKAHYTPDEIIERIKSILDKQK